jgi:hypothetical protein
MEIATAAAAVGAAGTGAVAAVAGVQAAAGALVPIAMSTFGTVVANVGTMHAAGGVAATLQAVSMAATPVGPAFAAGAALLVGAKVLLLVLL